MENKENQDGQLKIELTPEVAEGIYANLAIITHSSAECCRACPRLTLKAASCWHPSTPNACSSHCKTIS